MINRINSPGCERGSELLAWLYNEADEPEAREFELHFKSCHECQTEAASFGGVRDSIRAWRDEALSGFESVPVTMPASRKSALLALRQFFDLSPLWLKGATAVASIIFCALAASAIWRTLSPQKPAITGVKQDAVYTRDDVDRFVQEAVAREKGTAPKVEKEAVATNEPVNANPRPRKIVKPKQKIVPANLGEQFANSRRPLSKAERDRLAEDLRLLAHDDDAGLQLLGDRINQE